LFLSYFSKSQTDTDIYRDGGFRKQAQANEFKAFCPICFSRFIVFPEFKLSGLIVFIFSVRLSKFSQPFIT